ncbi:hypothetical protein SCLCIDRAFT_975003 [Scleroderma citrinum Foug A]|uniref:Uncharacterized protein n=1 Tax=Scleroderma citrinum Foug A TaxID=1036808 RepID=A0A0C3A5J2_9AGAM|nr:hypothetical protein SCLCIDRAFT_975003 [Scleroderma citrinum Foug A]
MLIVLRCGNPGDVTRYVIKKTQAIQGSSESIRYAHWCIATRDEDAQCPSTRCLISWAYIPTASQDLWEMNFHLSLHSSLQNSLGWLHCISIITQTSPFLRSVQGNQL